MSINKVLLEHCSITVCGCSLLPQQSQESEADFVWPTKPKRYSSALYSVAKEEKKKKR